MEERISFPKKEMLIQKSIVLEVERGRMFKGICKVIFIDELVRRGDHEVEANLGENCYG
jgi:hypothetical protein